MAASDSGARPRVFFHSQRSSCGTPFELIFQVFLRSLSAHMPSGTRRFRFAGIEVCLFYFLLASGPLQAGTMAHHGCMRVRVGLEATLRSATRCVVSRILGGTVGHACRNSRRRDGDRDSRYFGVSAKI